MSAFGFGLDYKLPPELQKNNNKKETSSEQSFSLFFPVKPSFNESAPSSALTAKDNAFTFEDIFGCNNSTPISFESTRSLLDVRTTSSNIVTSSFLPFDEKIGESFGEGEDFDGIRVPKLERLKAIDFCLATPTDVLAISEAEIHTPGISANADPEYTINDPRMGNTYGPCRTCHASRNETDCPGHFGHVDFLHTIINPLYFDDVCNIIRCFCLKCGSLLFEEPKHISLVPIRKLAYMAKIASNICPNKSCFHKQPIIHTQKKTDFGKKNPDIILTTANHVVYNIFPVEILAFLKEKVSEDDLAYIGVNFDVSSLFITRLPVMPMCCRPNVMGGCQDYLSGLLVSIIKANNQSTQARSSRKTKSKVTAVEDGLLSMKPYTDSTNTSRAMVYNTVLNTFKGSETLDPHGGPVNDSIATRMKGKEGRIRQNLLGKRCDYSARAVISPDPYVKLDEIILPTLMLQTLTRRVIINRLNREKCASLIRSGQVISVTRKGKTGIPHVIDLKTLFSVNNMINWNHFIILPYGQKPKIYKPHERPLKPVEFAEGDKLSVLIQNGDYVLFNRQPTLTRNNITGFRVRIFEGYDRNRKPPICSTKFNPAIVGNFNADFDGDEMNVHVPQGEQARAEVAEIMNIANNRTFSKNGKSCIGVIQDTVLSIYMMTKKGVYFEKDVFFNLCVAGDILYENFMSYEERYCCTTFEKLDCKEFYSGRTLFSLLLSSNFCFEKKTETDPNEPYVVIKNGVLLSGRICSKTIGNNDTYTIPSVMEPQESLDFISRISKLASAFLRYAGFSVGLDDVCEPYNYRWLEIKRKGGQIGRAGLSEKRMESLDDWLYRIYEERKKLSPVQPRLIEYVSGVKSRNFVEKCVPKNDDPTIQKIVQKYIKDLKEFLDHKESDTMHQDVKERHIMSILNSMMNKEQAHIYGKLNEDNAFKCMINSGSKGKTVNVCQISGILGVQTIDGARLQCERSAGKRITPHFTLEDKCPCKRGFVPTSFVDGLSPLEFFFSAQSARDSVSKVAGETPATGYAQRKLMNTLINLLVHYDGTVRYGGRIVQFVYGENGVHPERNTRPRGKNSFNFKDIASRLNSEYEQKMGFV